MIVLKVVLWQHLHEQEQCQLGMDMGMDMVLDNNNKVDGHGHGRVFVAIVNVRMKREHWMVDKVQGMHNKEGMAYLVDVDLTLMIQMMHNLVYDKVSFYDEICLESLDFVTCIDVGCDGDNFDHVEI